MKKTKKIVRSKDPLKDHNIIQCLDCNFIQPFEFEFCEKCKAYLPMQHRKTNRQIKFRSYKKSC